MTASWLLPLPVVVPIGVAVLNPLLVKLDRRLGLLAGAAAMVASLSLLVVVATTVFGAPGRIVVHYFGGQYPFGDGEVLGIAFAADPFGLVFALLTAALGTLLIVALLVELSGAGERELGGLGCLALLLLASLIGIALTADTFNAFVWFEVAALSSYGLTGFFLEQPPALEATFKAMVLVSTGGFVVFAASAMLYSADGALNFGQLHEALPHHVGRAELLALALLIAGYATKAGLAPFHGWVPDAHAQGPNAVPALFSALMVDLGVVMLVRLVLQVFGPDRGHHMLGLLTGLGIGSALLGALMALAQDDLKRLLAWDTVSQVGIMVAGFATATIEGVGGAVYHLINHGVFKALLFLVAGAVVHATGLTRLSELGGLARRRPVLAACFTIGALAIAGMPGTNGYVSLSLIHTGLEATPAILGLAVIAQVVTVAAFARACWLGFFRRRDREYETLQATPRVALAILALMAAGCLALGAAPHQLLRHAIEPAASGLLDPAGYASAVLQRGGPVLAEHLPFAFGQPSDLVLAGVEIVAGVLLAAAYLHAREPRPVSWLRRLHTGSVNDYAAYLAAGIVLAAGVLFGG